MKKTKYPGNTVDEWRAKRGKLPRRAQRFLERRKARQDELLERAQQTEAA